MGGGGDKRSAVCLPQTDGSSSAALLLGRGTPDLKSMSRQIRSGARARRSRRGLREGTAPGGTCCLVSPTRRAHTWSPPLDAEGLQVLVYRFYTYSLLQAGKGSSLGAKREHKNPPLCDLTEKGERGEGRKSGRCSRYSTCRYGR